MEETDPMKNISRSRSGHLRGEKVRTYLVSVPIHSKSPTIKQGHIKELSKTDTLDEIGVHIDEMENIVQNIQVINVECSKCVGSFKNMFNKCKVKSKVSVV